MSTSSVVEVQVLAWFKNKNDEKRLKPWCCGLNMKCSLQACVLEHLVTSWQCRFGNCGTFGRWSLAKRSMWLGERRRFEVIEPGSIFCFSLSRFLTIPPQFIICGWNMINQANIPAGFSSSPWGPECPLELRVKINFGCPELYSITTTEKSLTYVGPQDWTRVLALTSQGSGCLNYFPSFIFKLSVG